MYKVKSSSKYNDHAKEIKHGTVYPYSMTQGFQSGDIYTDGKALLFHHDCGFAFLSGDIDDAFAILYHKLSAISSDFSEFAIIYKKLTAEHHTLRSSFLIIISFIFFFACAEPSRYNRQIKRDRQYKCRNTVVGLNKNIKGRMEQYRCDKE